MKSKRQEKILELIAQYAIETQEELLERLSECGIPSTQATVSRDIKELRDYYDNTVPPIEIVFDRVRKGYVMRPYTPREDDE